MTNKPKIRSGIVGSGFAANLHYEGIERVYGAEVDLVGVFSPTETHARRFAEPRGLITFASLNALLDDVEVVHICASPAAHEAVRVAAFCCGPYGHGGAPGPCARSRSAVEASIILRLSTRL
jgi:predicted dehydrogenase